MDVLTRDSEFINCPHCQHQMRRGMIRCRECNGVVTEDFVLSTDVAAGVVALQRCSRCHVPLEPGVEDCPSCASQMLDQLLQAPAARAADASEAPPRYAGPAHATESRLRPPPALPPEAPRRRPAKRRNEPQRPRPDDEAEAGTDALYESETDSRSNRGRRTAPEIDRPPAIAEESAEAAASEACRSLLAALATPDPAALSSVVTALGQLGDRSAIPPLERLMGHSEIAVRRAAAEALMTLGHPKGSALREIAERRVQSTPVPPTRSAGSARRRSAPTDWGAMLKPGLALLGAVLLGGGIWWWQARPASSGRKSTTRAGAKSGKKSQTQPKAAATQPAAAPAVPPGGASVFSGGDP